MNVNEKASYIKGLADGLDYNKNTAEGKLIAALIDFTSELADKIAELEDQVDTLNDYIEEIDEDLGEVEEYLMDDDDDEDDCDDCDCYDCCDCCDCCDDDDDDDEDEDEDEDDEDFYEVVCPSCGETVYFDNSIDPDNLRCPACGEKFACLCEEEDLKEINEDK